MIIIIGGIRHFTCWLIGRGENKHLLSKVQVIDLGGLHIFLCLTLKKSQVLLELLMHFKMRKPKRWSV